MYSYTSTQDMRIRPNHSVDNSPIGELSAYTKGYGNEVFIATQEIIKNGVVIQSVGDKWFYVTSGASAMGWVAVVHLGRVYGILIEEGNEPPPEPTTPLSFDIHLQVRDNVLTSVTVDNEIWIRQ